MTNEFCLSNFVRDTTTLPQSDEIEVIIINEIKEFIRLLKKEIPEAYGDPINFYSIPLYERIDKLAGEKLR